MDIIEAHKFSIFNKSAILKSEICGCFYCLEIFGPGQIEEWAEELDQKESTAICPFCGIDSVLGSEDVKAINPEFLQRMQKHWFW